MSASCPHLGYNRFCTRCIRSSRFHPYSRIPVPTLLPINPCFASKARNPVPMLVEKVSHVLEMLHTAQVSYHGRRLREGSLWYRVCSLNFRPLALQDHSLEFKTGETAEDQAGDVQSSALSYAVFYHFPFPKYHLLPAPPCARLRHAFKPDPLTLNPLNPFS